jgi:predicted permease
MTTRRRALQNLDQEIHDHIQRETQENIDHGMSAEEARLAAVRRFGNVTLIKEDARAIWIPAWFEQLVQDLRYGFRMLRRNPGFTAVAVLSLALGIGAATGVYSVINAIVLHPYSYRGADRMAVLMLSDKSGPRGQLLVTARQLAELQKLDVLDGAVATDSYPMTITGGDLPETVTAMYLSSNAFEYYGIRLHLGRGFAHEEGSIGEEPRHVVVLGYKFWRSHYAGRPEALGQNLYLNHEVYTIIGVAGLDLFPSDATDRVFLPLRLTLDPKSAWAVQVRLKPGVTARAAEARLQPLLEQFAKETPARFPRDFRVVVNGLSDLNVGPVKPTLVLLLVATIVLLAIASANVSTLLVARGIARQHEFGVRHALGARPGRLFTQLLTESLVLSLIGASVGVLLAYVGLPVVLRWLPKNALPLVPGTIDVNAPVLLFGVGLAVVAGVIFGFLPALSLSQTHVGPILQANAARTTGSAQAQRTHHVLLASQVALTVVMLAGTGAAIRGLLALYRTTLGYDPTHILLFDARLQEDSHTVWEERAAFYEHLRTQIGSITEVEAVAVSVFTGVPPFTGMRRSVEIADRSPELGQITLVQIVSPEYFPALRIPLRSGRIWSTLETARAAPVTVINEVMARRFWPGEDPVGKRLRLPDFNSNNKYLLAAPGSAGADWLEVAGVVGDSLNRGLHEPISPSVYVPYTRLMGDIASFAVRTHGDPLRAERAIREQVKSIEPDLAILQVRTAEQDLNDYGWGRERFVAGLLLGFGIFALMLAGMGLYGAVSYTVSRRFKEFGIRMALGASRTSIIYAALRPAMLVIGAGLVAGLALSVVSNKIIARWSVGNLSDLVVLGTITVVLLAVTGAAALIPANRIASIHPVRALRID